MKKIKLIQGDCLKKMEKIKNGSIDMIIVDPPYKMTKQGNSCRPNYMKNRTKCMMLMIFGINKKNIFS